MELIIIIRIKVLSNAVTATQCELDSRAEQEVLSAVPHKHEKTRYLIYRMPNLVREKKSTAFGVNHSKCQ